MKTFPASGLLTLIALFTAPLILAGDGHFSCSQRNIRPGDKVTIKNLPPNHAGWMFSVNEGEISYLISFDSRIKSQFPPLISPDEFGKLNEITLDTSTAKGIPFVSVNGMGGRILGPARKIFTKSALYYIVVTSGLEEGAGGTYEKCPVRFTTPSADQSLLMCPEKVVRGANFTIGNLPASHEGWILSIRLRGTGTSRLLSFDHRVKSNLAPPISPQAFGKMTEIKLSTDSTKGLPFDIATHQVSATSERVFEKDGVYEIAVAPGFATGLPPAKHCNVAFSHT